MFFKFLKKNINDYEHSPGTIVATQAGKVIPITDVPDKVFSDEVLGKGVAILPQSGRVCSPVSGKIVSVADTFHAYAIRSDDGLDILVHIGINTVELKGKGFQNHVKEGDNVKVGTPLCDVDLPMIKGLGYPTYTPILITNMDAVKKMTMHTGNTVSEGTCVIEYEK